MVLGVIDAETGANIPIIGRAFYGYCKTSQIVFYIKEFLGYEQLFQ